MKIVNLADLLVSAEAIPAKGPSKSQVPVPSEPWKGLSEENRLFGILEASIRSLDFTLRKWSFWKIFNRGV